MTIPLTTSGGLFTRSGHLGGILGVGTTLTNPDLNSYSGTTVPNKVTQIANDYAATPDDRQLIDGIYSQTSGWQQAQGGYLQYIAQLMQNTLVQMANQDMPLPQPSIAAAMTLLIQQMTTAAASVKASVPTAGSQTAVGSPNGNPTILVSIDDNHALPLQYPFPETLNFTCVGDSQAGTGTLGQEPMQIQGAAQVGNPLSFNWPGGSGANLRMNCATSTVSFPSSGVGNALVNSDFETFTVANTPDNWPIGVGAAGTDIFSSSTAFKGLKSLEFLGTGAALLDSVSQQFSQNTGGTPFQLKPLTQYAFNFWVQTPVTPAAGVLQFDLATAATGGSIIQDAQGVNNAATVTLSGLTAATWTQKTGIFRTPAVLPANQFARLHLTTAIDSGKDVLIDSLCFAPMVQLYPGGPWVAIFSNQNTLITGDAWTLAIGNTYGLFQKLFEKVFGMRTNGFVLPNAGSPTINDNLIA